MELLKIKKISTNKNILLVLIGILIVLLSSIVLIHKYYFNNKLDKLENISIDAFFDEPITDDKDSQIKQNLQKEKVNNIIDYSAILEVPKINLKRGIVDKNSSYNNVNKNIYVVSETTFPDEQENSHVILAAHSGNSHVSFFKDLDKLSIDDEVYFYYKNIKYVYKISNRYEVEKTGKINLELTDKSDITLITCINGTNKQVVLVAKINSTQNY